MVARQGAGDSGAEKPGLQTAYPSGEAGPRRATPPPRAPADPTLGRGGEMAGSRSRVLRRGWRAAATVGCQATMVLAVVGRGRPATHPVPRFAALHGIPVGRPRSRALFRATHPRLLASRDHDRHLCAYAGGHRTPGAAMALRSPMRVAALTVAVGRRRARYGGLWRDVRASVRSATSR